MNQDTLHPGIAMVVVMLDELVHQVQPDGSISHCLDITCPCWDDGVPPMPPEVRDLYVSSPGTIDEPPRAADIWQNVEDSEEDLRFNAWHGSNRD